MRSADGPSKLFVAGLGENRKDDLTRVFNKYGEVRNVYVDERKQFAFVEFGSSFEAQKALQCVNHMKVNGFRLRVEFARSEKIVRENRRSSSRERFPSSNFYEHSQFSAGRSTQVQGFRSNFYPYPTSSMLINSSAMSRGRSLTPPSFKQNGRIPSMNGDFYPAYPSPLYMEPNFYRPYDDPYVLQRLAPFPTRPYFPPYAPREIHRFPPNIPRRKSRSRSPSRRRISPYRERTNREEKNRRRISRSPSPSPRDRNPRNSHRSRKRSRSTSSENVSIIEQKISSPSDNDEDDKQSAARSSTDDNSNQKYSRKKRRD